MDGSVTLRQNSPLLPAYKTFASGRETPSVWRLGVRSLRLGARYS
jgi:hypothetical protein